MSDESKTPPEKDNTGSADVKNETPAPKPDAGKDTPKPDEKVGDDKKDAKVSEPELKKGSEGQPERIVPETYDLKVPDGALINAAHVDKIKAYAKDNKLTLAEAQGMVDRDNANFASFVESQKGLMTQKSNEWIESVKSDKELGGEGFDKNVELAKRVITKYGTDEFKKALDETQLGNHPELVRFLVRIGKGMADDQFVPAGEHVGSRKSAVDVLYGKSEEK